MKGEYGRVFLVGAGCGDAELITLKGLRLLRQCDVVCYDELIPLQLLEETKAGCERIPVGKRFAAHSAKQEEIQDLLIAKAGEGKTVVRLKGGDPFVFGRGGEEALALQAAKIPYEVVPGISSAIAVPAAAGIPVTHRRMARSFHVITGHTAEDGAGVFTENFQALARLSGTLIFLMGLHHLEEIAAGLLAEGKSPETPAAVISKGTTAAQRVVRASLSNLAAAVRQAALEAPAVILIGETAGLNLASPQPLPLQGVKVGVTGTKSLTGRLSQGLRQLGAETVVMDYARLLPYGETLPLAKDLECLSSYHWAVFTSPNGVDVFFELLLERERDIRSLAGLRFAAIGTGTAAALKRRGILVDFLPKRYDVESLAEGLCQMVKKEERILILRAEQGSPILTEKLQAAGLDFTDRKLYDIEIDKEKLRFAEKQMQGMDFITFASGSGVRGFFENGGKLPAGTKAVCIGEITAGILREYGFSERIVAGKFNVDGIIREILREVEKK